MAAKSTKSVVAPKSEKVNPSPYRVGSSYWCVVECLYRLGFGKFHGAAALLKLYPKVMGAEAFKAFADKAARNEATGKDTEGRIIQNALVVTRKDRYGVPAEFGFEVRKQRTDKGYEFGLFKTNGKASQKPQDASKGNGKGKTAPAKAKAQKGK